MIKCGHSFFLSRMIDGHFHLEIFVHTYTYKCDNKSNGGYQFECREE